MRISELLKDYRERMQLSQRKFSEACKLSNTMINFIENERNPKTGKPMELSLATYKKLSNGMGITLQQLFDTLGDDAVVANGLSEDEQVLITAWRMADQYDRELAKRALHIEEEKKPSEQSAI